MNRRQINRLLITALTLVVCSALWLRGLQRSVILNPDLIGQRPFVRQPVGNNAADIQAERALAMAYWLRYPDVRQDELYGEDGLMGILGPRAHYNQHGRQERRIFALVQVPDDLAMEEELAEAYWTRYPDIADSAIWGKKSKLSILGPRDHYIHFGKAAGLQWGVERNGNGQIP